MTTEKGQNETTAPEEQKKVTNINEAFKFYVGEVEDSNIAFLLKAQLVMILDKIKLGELSVEDMNEEEFFSGFSEVHEMNIKSFDKSFFSNFGYIFNNDKYAKINTIWQEAKNELKKPIDEKDYSVAMVFYQKQTRECLAKIFQYSYNMEDPGKDISAANKSMISYETTNLLQLMGGINSLSKYKPDYSQIDLTIV